MDGDSASEATLWNQPELVPPTFGPEGFPDDAFAATIDVAGDISTVGALTLGSGDADAPGLGDLVAITGALSLQAGGAIDASTGVNSAIEGDGTLINDGEIVSIGGKAGSYSNSLLTIGGDPGSSLTFRNMGEVVVGENFSDHGEAAGAGAIVVTAALDPASTGTWVIESRGALEIASDPNHGATYDFAPTAGLGPYEAPSGGVLIIDNPGASFDEAVIGFDANYTVPNGLFAGERIASGTIVLQGVGPVGNAELNTASHTLRLYADAGTADPIYAFTDFDAGSALASSARDGMVDLTGLIVGTAATACFAAGARIAIRDGEIAVEALRPGDEVRTLDGGSQPILWIGRRRIDLGDAPPFDRARPVIVAAQAFDDGMPARDLRLSGDHAVFIDGALTPIRVLINGGTIRHDFAAREIAYLHLELAAHHILLADGLPAESWLDTGNRTMFDNADPKASAPGRSGPGEGRWPLVDRGPGIDALRRRLAERADALGQPTRAELVVQIRRPGLLLVNAPPGSSCARLISGCVIDGRDLRGLGALLASLRLSDATLPFDGRHLERGFHAPELHGDRTVCWTDGDAVVAFAPDPAARVLEIDVVALAEDRSRAA